jgi:hypothetical protein
VLFTEALKDVLSTLGSGNPLCINTPLAKLRVMTRICAILRVRCFCIRIILYFALIMAEHQDVSYDPIKQCNNLSVDSKTRHPLE